MTKVFVYLFCSLCLSVSGVYGDVAEKREWTSSTGQKVKAQLLKFSGKRIWLKTGNGKIVDLPIEKISAGDIKRVKSWKTKNSSGLNVPDGPFEWPLLYRGRDRFNVKYVRFDKDKKYHLYETEYFDFYVEEKLNHSTIWKCMALFYHVAGVLDSLPIYLESIPREGEKKYEIFLVASKAKYRAMGGPPNSGGFYDPKRNITVIPFMSLGIIKDGKKWTFDAKGKSYSTLIHELTHHLTCKKWKGQPCWLEEGMADFIATMPYRASEFRFHQPGLYIQEDFKKSFEYTKIKNVLIPNGVYQAISVEYMLSVPRSRWNMLLARDQISGMRQYHTSMIMFYYFAFLDGEGDGANLVKFMHAQRKAFMERKIPHPYNKALLEKYLLRGRSFKELEKEMVKELAANKLKVVFR